MIAFLAPIPPMDEARERSARAVRRSRLCWLVVLLFVVLLAGFSPSDVFIAGGGA